MSNLVETLQSLMMRRILLGGKRLEREGRQQAPAAKEVKGDDGDADEEKAE